MWVGDIPVLTCGQAILQCSCVVGDIAVLTCGYAKLPCSRVGGRYCSAHLLLGDIAGVGSRWR